MLHPYDYQRLAIDHAVERLRYGHKRTLYAAPTGTGKSVIELYVQDRLENAWIVTPRIEIIIGLLEKRGVSEAGDLPLEKLIEMATVRQISTPTRLRNALLNGSLAPPSFLIIDESHHQTAETYQQIDLLCGLCPAVGYTATPYRGTPGSTAVLYKHWGEPVWILTYPEAIERGVLAFPTCRTVPLVDDDIVTVQNGEFVVEQVEHHTSDRLQQIVAMLKLFWDGQCYDRPIMFSLPSSNLARQLAAKLWDAKLPNALVLQDTPHAARKEAFEDAVDRKAALVQVQVVSEGVDLPIRRLIDLSPVISPVRWLQQFGRITRPVVGGEPPPEYICCNRNLLRHAYLLEGCLPPVSVRQAEEAFGNVASVRVGLRVIGLEGLGRFKAAELPLKEGFQGAIYSLSAVNGLTVTEYCCLVHPLRAEPLWASRERSKYRQGEPMQWGRWRRCPAPEDLSGFASVPPSIPSEKQLAWWKRSARRHGLNETASVNRKNFIALPVMSDTAECF